MRLELTRLTSLLNVSEQACQRLQQQLAEGLLLRDDMLEVQGADYKARYNAIQGKYRSAASQLEISEVELTAAKEQLINRAATISRLELSYNTDTARLEKKISYQVCYKLDV